MLETNHEADTHEIERMLIHFIILRNIKKYRRWLEWWHLDLHQASVGILLECQGKWLLFAVTPTAEILPCCCNCWNQNEYLGLLPYSENVDTLESTSTHNIQKSPESVSEMVDPRKCLPWGSTLSSQGPRWCWMQSSKIWPLTLSNVSNRQGLAPCSILWPETSKIVPIRSSPKIDRKSVV